MSLWLTFCFAYISVASSLSNILRANFFFFEIFFVSPVLTVCTSFDPKVPEFMSSVPLSLGTFGNRFESGFVLFLLRLQR